MKSKYISPKVNIHQMIPASIVCTSFDTNDTRVGDASSMAASREDDFWDEDDSFSSFSADSLWP